MNGYLFRGVLLLGLVLIGYYAFARRNRLPLHLFVILGLLGAGATFVIEPELANLLAHSLGLWRGADLVIYVLAVLLLFSVLHLAIAQSELNRSLTQVVRELAILRSELEARGSASPDEARSRSES